jgi:hypothetical protein
MSYDVSNTIQKLFDDEGLRNILLNIDEFFDNIDLYVFKNWIDGELVEGPNVSKYWVDVSFKYLADKMPDPKGAYLFVNQGTKVEFRKDIEHVPVEIPMSPNDIQPNGKPQIKEVPIFIVRFTIPRKVVDSSSMQEYDIADREPHIDSSDSEEIPQDGTTDQDTINLPEDDENAS